jgi:hypothetical protein
MIIFEFINSEGGFAKRTRESLVRNLTISIAIGLVVSFINGWIWGVGIATFFFIVQSFKSKRWDRTFIDKVVFDEGNVTISYTEQNNQKIIEGKLNDFNLKKEIAFNRTRTAYLAIYFLGSLKLKQFEIGDWSEYKMDELINLFKENITPRQ